MPQLQRIKIEGYRSIKSLDLNLRDINVLIGPNAAGKSNFIRFFQFLQQIVDENLQEYVRRSGDAASLLYYGPQTTSSLSGGFYFQPNGYLFQLTPTEDGRLVFHQERVRFEGEEDVDRPSGRGHTETKLFQAQDKPWSIPGYVVAGGWTVYHFQITGTSAPPKQSTNIRDDRQLHSDVGNVAAFLSPGGRHRGPDGGVQPGNKRVGLTTRGLEPDYRAGEP